MKKTLFTIIFIFFITHFIEAQTDTFEIVFVNEYQKINDDWLDEIKNDWGATGVSLIIEWEDIELTGGNYAWDNTITTKLQSIKNKGLDIYVRVRFGFGVPAWAEPGNTYFSNNDYQIKSDGSIYTPPYGRPFNFASDFAKDHILTLYDSVVSKLFFLDTSNNLNIKEIVPSVSIDSELEYPHGTMCGYSQPEIEQFHFFLEAKYNNTIANLNSIWGSSFSTFDTIDPKDFDWDNVSPYNYTYSSGRYDWMQFRTNLLKSFIDEFANVTHTYGFKMGLQLGCIYDNLIERRGWYDVTSLIENVDAVRVAEIIEYTPNFTFGADYLRSICDFWERTTTNEISFSTETNRPTHNDHIPSTLSNRWAEQLGSYYDKGAKQHFIVQWEDTSTLNSNQSSFQGWRDTLLYFSGKDVVDYNNTGKAVHLSCERGYYEGNGFTIVQYSGDTATYMKFEFISSISAKNPYGNNTNNYDGECDILTNFMIINNPNYLDNYYTDFWFTESSYHIPDGVYLNLMNESVQISMGNATWFNDNGHGEFAYTHGIRDEYNNYRSPIHLIWRSRSDLQAIWSDANLPDSGSGVSYDFVTWARNYGCGNIVKPPDPEYPEWSVYEHPVYVYDENLKKVWDDRTDLQGYYPNAHNLDTGSAPVNMISWAKNYGYSEETELENYNYWPYVGGLNFNRPSSIIETNSSTLPNKYELYQNYPNPFNPVTKIKFDIPNKGKNGNVNARLVVYNILGQEMEVLVNQELQAGSYEYVFDGSNLSSGIYFYHIEAGNYIATRKMLMIK